MAKAFQTPRVIGGWAEADPNSGALAATLVLASSTPDGDFVREYKQSITGEDIPVGWLTNTVLTFIDDLGAAGYVVQS